MGFSDKIAARGSGYLDRTEARLTTLMQAIDTGPLDLFEVRRTFHDIVGTAPVFGFAKLGEKARGAESLAVELQDGGSDGVGRLREVVRDLIETVAESRSA